MANVSMSEMAVFWYFENGDMDKYTEAYIANGG